MAFCAQCGAESEGNFCPKCGAPRGGAAAHNPMAQPAPLEENLAGALCYSLGLLTGILFLVLEPYNRSSEIRFHAMQSILVSAGFFVISAGLMFLSYVPLVGLLALVLLPLLYLAGFGLWVFLMFKTYNRERVVLPVVGPMAANQA